MMLNQTVELGVLDVGWIIHAKTSCCFFCLCWRGELEGNKTVQEDRILIHCKSLEITSSDSQWELKKNWSSKRLSFKPLFTLICNETGLNSIWAAGVWPYLLSRLPQANKWHLCAPKGCWDSEDIVSGCFDIDPSVVVINISPTQVAGHQERRKGLSDCLLPTCQKD